MRHWGRSGARRLCIAVRALAALGTLCALLVRGGIWCGRAAESSGKPDPDQAAHDAVECMQHCLCTAVPQPATPLLPSVTALLPPAGAGIVATPAPSDARGPEANPLGASGARAPPTA